MVALDRHLANIGALRRQQPRRRSVVPSFILIAPKFKTISGRQLF